MEETWEPVGGKFADYSDIYEVSDLGAVRSKDRLVITKSGVSKSLKGRILKPSVHRSGHYFVVLCGIGKPRTVRVHRLVAETFISNPDKLPLVRHLNDDKTNNTVSNLAWGTDSDNKLDAVRNGIHPETLKTHCKWGHPYQGDNLRIEAGRRICKACKSHQSRKQKQSKAGQEPPKHGTANAYNVYKCRCEECRRFWKSKNRASYEKRAAKKP